MKKSKILLSTIILGTMAFGGAAIAEHHEGGHKGKHFEKMDSNADGKISMDEHLTAAKERFAKMDQDSDGFVTKDEARALKKKMRDKRPKPENTVE